MIRRNLLNALTESAGVLMGIVVSICSILNVWMTLLVVPNALKRETDFSAFYGAGHLFLSAPSTLFSQTETAPWVHLPFELFLFAPLSLLNYKSAWVVFACMNFVVLGLIWKLLKPPLYLLAFCPIWIAISWGQDSILLLAVLAGAVTCIRKEKLMWAGLVLGIGMFRFQDLLPIVFLLVVWREWRIIRGFLWSGGISVLVSAAIVNAREYLATLHGLTQHPALHAPVDRMVSLRGLFHADTRLSSALLIATCAIATLCCVLIGKHQNTEQRFVLAIWLTALVSFHFFGHDLSILILPLAAMSGKLKDFAGALMLAASTTTLLDYMYIVPIAVALCFAGVLLVKKRETRTLSAVQKSADLWRVEVAATNGV